MPPEMRENTGEIEASLKGILPDVIDYTDICGDFHVHTTHSDGEETVEEMATAAFQKGYSYLCISDHSKSEIIAGGMKEDELIDELKEINALNSKFTKSKKKFRVFSGCEVDIKGNGELDFDDDILKRIDIVTCSVHSGFKSPKEKMTERILTAMDNKYMKILAHPTGRIINARPPYEVDLDKVFEKASDKGIAIEINASPGRLDLNDVNIRKAISYGAKLVIGTDSHNMEQLRFMDLGVAMARRGWAEKKDILNTHSIEEVMKFFKIRE
jgi:DNA polymerase (family 10)